jgi:hypothetical protein
MYVLPLPPISFIGYDFFPFFSGHECTRQNILISLLPLFFFGFMTNGHLSFLSQSVLGAEIYRFRGGIGIQTERDGNARCHFGKKPR